MFRDLHQWFEADHSGGTIYTTGMDKSHESEAVFKNKKPGGKSVSLQ